MNYDYDELTPEVVRGVRFRERYRGYDPADVDPLIERLAATLEQIHDALRRLDEVRLTPPRPRPAPDQVAALAAMLHIGFAAREARTIVATARKRTGLTTAVAEQRMANEERARALLRRPTSVD